MLHAQDYIVHAESRNKSCLQNTHFITQTFCLNTFRNTSHASRRTTGLSLSWNQATVQLWTIMEQNHWPALDYHETKPLGHTRTYVRFVVTSLMWLNLLLPNCLISEESEPETCHSDCCTSGSAVEMWLRHGRNGANFLHSKMHLSYWVSTPNTYKHTASYIPMVSWSVSCQGCTSWNMSTCTHSHGPWRCTCWDMMGKA